MATPTVNYNPNTPLPKDRFNDSQDQFLQNFSFLYDAFANNHIALDAASGAGNHTVIEFPEQNSPFQANAGEISVYSRKIEGQTDQLFLRYQGNQAEFPLSLYQIYILHIPGVQSTYLTFLPGNLLVYFGETGNTGGIDLQPYISKNVVSVTVCGFQLPLQTPNTSLETSGGFYKRVNFGITPVGQNDTFARYFFVVTNI